MSMDYIPRDTFFHRLNPITKMLYFLAMMWPTMTSTDPISLFLVLILVSIIFFLAKLPKTQLKELFIIVLLSSPIYIVFGMFFVPCTPESLLITYLYPPTKFVPITVDAVLFILQAIIKVFIVLVSFRTLPLTTPIPDIVRGLVKLKMPPSIAVATSSTFAYVPVMYNESKTIQEAQLSRGLRGLEDRNPFKRFRAMLALIIPILVCSIRRSGELAAALLSRGFGYRTSKRTYLVEFTFRKSDYVAIAMMLAFIVAVSYYGIWFLGVLDYKLTVKIVKDLFYSATYP